MYVQREDSITAAATPPVRQPAIIRYLAHFFSWVFHPMFISSYVMYFLIFIHPYAFAGVPPLNKTFKFIGVFFTTAFLPAFAVFIMWRLKLVLQSIYLRTAKERIIPYLIAMIFYWWIWHVYENTLDSPAVATRFLLGAFLAVCGVWFCNIYFKVSMHATSVGGLIVFLLLFSLSDSYGSGLYLSLGILVAGIVCTSRFIVSDHSSFDIYAGLGVGALSQFIAWQF